MAHAEDLEGPDQSPTSRLVTAILLSALKKRVTGIHLRKTEKTFIVYFERDGIEEEEMRPPMVLHQNIVQRISAMAGVPYIAVGKSGRGHIHLLLSGNRHAHFDVMIDGHGSLAQLALRLTDG